MEPSFEVHPNEKLPLMPLFLTVQSSNLFN